MAAENRFWKGFGLSCCPSFAGKSILEIGCGAGQRSIEAAAHGSNRVVGLDTRGVFPTKAPEGVTFFKGELATFPPEQFDIVVSENTLEHVMDVPDLLAQVRSRLKPGGRFYIGFGPLYHAPDGDHGWLRAVLPGRRIFTWPWGHLLLKRTAFRNLTAQHGKAVTQTHDWPYLDLNQHTVDEYERMFRDSGMRIAYLRKNDVRSLKAKLFASLGKFTFLSQYFTLNLYVILEHVPG
jgi:SAM-dependent methyltransferase